MTDHRTPMISVSPSIFPKARRTSYTINMTTNEIQTARLATVYAEAGNTTPAAAPVAAAMEEEEEEEEDEDEEAVAFLPPEPVAEAPAPPVFLTPDVVIVVEARAAAGTLVAVAVAVDSASRPPAAPTWKLALVPRVSVQAAEADQASASAVRRAMAKGSEAVMVVPNLPSTSMPNVKTLCRPRPAASALDTAGSVMVLVMAAALDPAAAWPSPDGVPLPEPEPDPDPDPSPPPAPPVVAAEAPFPPDEPEPSSPVLPSPVPEPPLPSSPSSSQTSSSPSSEPDPPGLVDPSVLEPDWPDEPPDAASSSPLGLLPPEPVPPEPPVPAAPGLPVAPAPLGPPVAVAPGAPPGPISVLTATRVSEFESGLSLEAVTSSSTMSNSDATGWPMPDRSAKSWTSKFSLMDGLALISVAQAVQLNESSPVCWTGRLKSITARSRRLDDEEDEDEEDEVEEDEEEDDDEKSPEGSSKFTKGSSEELSSPPLMLNWEELFRLIFC